MEHTLLHVLDGTRGAGSHKRRKDLSFLPQVHSTQSATHAGKNALLADVALEREESMFLVRRAIRLRQERI